VLAVIDPVADLVRQRAGEQPTAHVVRGQRDVVAAWFRHATAASTPGARRPTATSSHRTRRSSTSAGAQRSRATSIPATPGLRRELDTYLRFYNFDRVQHGRLTHGQIPADIAYGARKMEAR
jgi:hypothetical protein